MTDAPAPDAVRLQIHADGVAELILARPEAGNALRLSSCRELRAKAEVVSETQGVRAVLLHAQGRAFCVGGDLGDFAAAPAPGRLLDEMAEALHAALLTLRRLPAPIVVAVQGAAAGAGLGLAAVGDLVLASPQAKFAWAYTAVGLSGDGGVTWLLPRLIGLRRTQELAFASRTLDAAEAVRIGLVTRLVEDGDLVAAAWEEARRIARGPTAAYGAVKRLLDSSLTTPFADQLEVEQREIAVLAATGDSREGVRAFLERRPAVFTGGAAFAPRAD